jgi:beta-N-acetylhexosaminidase
LQAPFASLYNMIDKEKFQAILSAAPYCLSQEDIDWVEKTACSLELHQKLGQLINVQVFPDDKRMIEEAIEHQLGAVTVINFASPDACKSVIDRVKGRMNIPPLVCADLEGGVTSGNMTSSFPNQLGCAAANNIEAYGQALGALSKELTLLGINWTFSPVLDVNETFQSAIVGTRSYGSDPNLISAMANEHIRVFQASAIATTAKHWPGEGFDARDQHLLTTINPLQMDKWRDVFGRLYAKAIDTGVLSVMSAHIALPEYASSCGESGVELYRPASISKHLNQTLLRKEMGFNGVIISDATLMGGLESWGPRKQWLPELVQNGCDMLLFSISASADIDTLLAAVESGALGIERVDEALIRVLGLKAKLKLHRNEFPSRNMTSMINLEEHKLMMSNLSSLSTTLVKDTRNLIPISTHKFKNILLFKEENINPLGGGDEFQIQLDKQLIEEGFEVKVFDPKCECLDIYLEFDLIIYAVAQESQLTKSHLYLDWASLHGGTLPGMKRLWWDKPTIFISFGHPYYLYDAPRMPCLINAYTPTPGVQKAVIEKLMGRSPFLGKSPIDPLCQLPDAIY